MSRKNNLFLARLPRISANLNENYRPYNFQALATISGKFREILNFRKIHNPSGKDLCIGKSSLSFESVSYKNTHLRDLWSAFVVYPVSIL